MNKTRKGKWYLGAVIAFVSLGTVACTAAQISAYINLAATLATDALNIYSAIGGQPVSAHDAALVTQWQQALQATVASEQANQKAGNSALIAVAQAAETNLPAFLAAAQFDNPVLASRITVGTDSFLAIVESIATLAGAPAPATPAVALKSGGVYHLPIRAVVSKKDIINEWNAGVCPNPNSACYAK